MVIMGIQYIAIPFTCTTFWDFVVSYTLIGMTFGCQLTLPIVILNDYLGKREKENQVLFGLKLDFNQIQSNSIS